MCDGDDAPVYAGEVMEGRIHGGGAYFFTNGDSYSGGWKDGLPHGRGLFVRALGGSYDGEWGKDFGMVWAHKDTRMDPPMRAPGSVAPGMAEAPL